MAYAYNVDYWPGNTSIIPTREMIKLRYANYPKDYFLGVLPASQYGSVAVLPSYLRPDLGSNLIVASDPKSSAPDNNPTVVNPTKTTSVITSNSNSSLDSRFLNVNSDLSALSIRATEYLQRWKEVVQFSSKDYSDQMAALS